MALAPDVSKAQRVHRTIAVTATAARPANDLPFTDARPDLLEELTADERARISELFSLHHMAAYNNSQLYDLYSRQVADNARAFLELAEIEYENAQLRAMAAEGEVGEGAESVSSSNPEASSQTHDCSHPQPEGSPASDPHGAASSSSSNPEASSQPRDCSHPRPRVSSSSDAHGNASSSSSNLEASSQARGCSQQAVEEKTILGGSKAESDTVLGLEEGITTLVVRNLPLRVTQEDLLRLWPPGIAYDFLYLPRCGKHNRFSSYVFVNFRTARAAQDFFREWQGASLVHLSRSRELSIGPAKCQGLAANMLHSDWSVQGGNYLPAVFDAASGRLDFLEFWRSLIRVMTC